MYLTFDVSHGSYFAETTRQRKVSRFKLQQAES